MMTSRAKAQIYQNLARRLNAMGGDVGDPESITHDERSEIKILEAVVDRLEAVVKRIKKAS